MSHVELRTRKRAEMVAVRAERLRCVDIVTMFAAECRDEAVRAAGRPSGVLWSNNADVADRIADRLRLGLLGLERAR